MVRTDRMEEDRKDAPGGTDQCYCRRSSLTIRSRFHLVGALLECRYLKLIKSVRLNVEALGFKGSFLAFALF